MIFFGHTTQLELIDVQGKHKRLVSYNKNHGTSALKKHVCHEHLDLYKKWGRFLLHKVAKTQSDKQETNKSKIVPPSQITNFFDSQWPYHKSNPL